MSRTNKVFGVILSVVLLAAAMPAKTTHSSGKKKSSQTSTAKKTSSKSSTTHSKSKTSSTHTAPSHSKKGSAHVKNASYTTGRHGKKSKIKKVRGQQSIDSERAREIQAALIREHYLEGEPSGAFDDSTKRALQKYQQDNGWQTKVIPDSRALIKLGLGPSKDGLLNPESAAMGQPFELGVEREIPGGAAPGQRK